MLLYLIWWCEVRFKLGVHQKNQVRKHYSARPSFQRIRPSLNYCIPFLLVHSRGMKLPITTKILLGITCWYLNFRHANCQAPFDMRPLHRAVELHFHRNIALGRCLRMIEKAKMIKMLTNAAIFFSLRFISTTMLYLDFFPTRLACCTKASWSNR